MYLQWFENFVIDKVINEFVILRNLNMMDRCVLSRKDFCIPRTLKTNHLINLFKVSYFFGRGGLAFKDNFWSPVGGQSQMGELASGTESNEGDLEILSADIKF